MKTVSIVIPNYNGAAYLEACFSALNNQSYKNFEVLLVDNGSEDDSLFRVEALKESLDVRIISLDRNYGFSKAVNEGIRASQGEYVILLNNDTKAGVHFVEQLVAAMDSDADVFSAQALMLQFQDRSLTDSAGDYFCSLGWAFSRGKDEPAEKYTKVREIFSACAGAAIYRKSILDQIGLFDESFFAYLEDVDIGYRAKLYGYKNIVVPKARVLHVGSGSSGSRHNAFKVGLSSRNAIMVMYKNFSLWQWVVNGLPILAGILVKLVYFSRKGLGRVYWNGVTSAFSKMPETERIQPEHTPPYGKIQWELFINVIRRSGFIHED